MIDTVAVPACPVCGAAGYSALYSGLTDRVFGVAPGAWTLVRCSRCGVARLDPRPSDAAIGDLYARYYTHGTPPQVVAPQGLAGVARSLAEGHLRGRGAGSLLGRLLPPFAAIAERRVRGLSPGARVLDVGAGNGAWVAEAVAAGLDAAGIDLDAVAVEAGRAAGLDLRVERLEDRAAEEPERFDAVTLSHVIEHVPDPVAFLRAASALLRPGGTVWVATPNLDALGHRAFGPDWLHLDPPRHLVLFDATGLAHALARAGFAAVRLKRATPNAMPSFVISHAVRTGVVPANDVTTAPHTVLLGGLAAELRAQHDARLAEELVMVARRP